MDRLMDPPAFDADFIARDRSKMKNNLGHFHVLVRTLVIYFGKHTLTFADLSFDVTINKGINHNSYGKILFRGDLSKLIDIKTDCSKHMPYI